MLTPNLKNTNVRGNRFLSPFLFENQTILPIWYTFLPSFPFLFLFLFAVGSVHFLVCLFLTFNKSLMNVSVVLWPFYIHICIYLCFSIFKCASVSQCNCVCDHVSMCLYVPITFVSLYNENLLHVTPSLCLYAPLPLPSTLSLSISLSASLSPINLCWTVVAQMVVWLLEGFLSASLILKNFMGQCHWFKQESTRT